MAKILIGNVKGKDGRGISKIAKTASTGTVDTYTITYTDSTTSTFTINNSDSISLQRQIVPSAAVESSTTASQAYAAGDYVAANGVLRKVTAAIAKGNTIGNSNSTATTVTGELANLVSPKLLATTSGTASAAINVSGVSLLVVVAKNKYVGITTAIVPVAALSNTVDTVHMAGGYRASDLHLNYDCRMSLTTFAGRDAYNNGTNHASETKWSVYGLL